MLFKARGSGIYDLLCILKASEACFDAHSS